jgi:hypothetical protein
MFEDLSPGHDLSGSAHEELQQRELARGQSHGFSSAGYDV